MRKCTIYGEDQNTTELLCSLRCRSTDWADYEPERISVQQLTAYCRRIDMEVRNIKRRSITNLVISKHQISRVFFHTLIHTTDDKLLINISNLSSVVSINVQYVQWCEAEKVQKLVLRDKNKNKQISNQETHFSIGNGFKMAWLPPAYITNIRHTVHTNWEALQLFYFIRCNLRNTW